MTANGVTLHYKYYITHVFSRNTIIVMLYKKSQIIYVFSAAPLIFLSHSSQTVVHSIIYTRRLSQVGMSITPLTHDTMYTYTEKVHAMKIKITTTAQFKILVVT